MKRSLGEKIGDVTIITSMCLIIIIMLFPIWNTLVVSFNEARDSLKGSLYLWPRDWTLFNYQSVFKTDKVFNAFLISVYRTLITLVVNVLLSSLLAYILSRKEFVFRKFLTTFMVITMYINAGLIPQYFLYRDLKLIDRFWVYILPTMVSAFNVIVIRTYINTLPDSLVESAKIDGASEMRIFLQIIIPLCLPVMATVALWAAVGAWNDWFTSFIFAPKQNLSTLQYEMMKILSSSMQSGVRQPDYMASSMQTRSMVTPNSLRAAMTTVPILIVYPFLQKYFVTVNIGGVKG